MSILLALGGCGRSPNIGDEAWEEEIKSSLAGLASLDSFRYRFRLETWIGVSGYTVYGDETGEGFIRGNDFTTKVVRTSPEGEEEFTISCREEKFFLEKNGEENPAEGSEIPGLLHRPRSLLELAAGYKSTQREGEDEYEGLACRRYLLEYEDSLAPEILPSPAQEYFSNLDFSLQGRIWIRISDDSPLPAAIRLELIGLDRVEKLQRLRLVFTFQPLPG